VNAKNRKVTIEFDAKHEAIVRRALALAEEMEPLALTALDGQLIHVCETAVIEKGRQFQAQVLSQAVVQRIEAVEKKGPPCAAVRADDKKKTKAPNNANS
jgi:hypothetical protein